MKTLYTIACVISLLCSINCFQINHYREAIPWGVVFLLSLKEIINGDNKK